MTISLARLALVSALLASATPAIGQAKQSFALGDVTASEEAGKALIPVRKVGTNRRVPSSVILNIVGLPGDTAKAGDDFQAIRNLPIPFGADELSKTVEFTLTNDALPEGTEFVTGKITPGLNARLYDGTNRITITDSDTITPPPPICPSGTVLSPAGHCETPPPPTPEPVLCPDGSSVIPPATCPVPPVPPVAGWEPSPTIEGVTPIPSNFDINTGLVDKAIPPSADPDVVGAFRFICNAGQLRYDDPIVYPGQPGKSHLHQFYGNEGADAFSTYSSLRTKAATSSCEGSNRQPLNASAYWMPAMLDGNGNVVRPDFVSIYYKRRPMIDPVCNGKPGTPLAGGKAVQGQCVRLPNGLKFIFGFDMLTGKAPTGSLWFNCGGVKFDDLEAPECNVAGRQVGAVIEAPDCWDGKNLDSPNHRDHVSYSYYDPNSGQLRCDDGHPFVIPRFQLGAFFTVPAGSRLGLSSDAMVPGIRRGKTFHADFWMSWDATVHGMWEDNCLNKKLNCDSGDLGNGKQIRDMWIRSDPRPRIVAISSIPLN